MKMINKKDVTGSMLTLSLWLLASFLVMPIAKMYIGPAIVQFFHVELTSYKAEKIFFITFLVYNGSMVLTFFITYFIKYRHVLYIGISFLGVGIILLMVSIFFAGLFISIGLGIVSIPAISSVSFYMRNTHWNVSIDGEVHAYRGEIQFLKNKKNRVLPKHVVHPIGAFIGIPLLVGLTIFLQNIVAVALVGVVVVGILLYLLFSVSDFGDIVSKSSVAKIYKSILKNSMAHLIIVLMFLVTIMDMLTIYKIPILLLPYLNGENTLTAVVLLFLIISRVTMILFSELTLVQIPPRRLVFFSGFSVGVLSVILMFPLDNKSQVLVFFTASLMLSVIFPAILKSIAQFVQFSVLPFMNVIIILMVNIVMVGVYKYLFPQLSARIVFQRLYVILGLIFIVFSIVFFLVSYRRIKK